MQRTIRALADQIAGDQYFAQAFLRTIEGEDLVDAKLIEAACKLALGAVDYAAATSLLRSELERRGRTSVEIENALAYFCATRLRTIELPPREVVARDRILGWAQPRAGVLTPRSVPTVR